MTEATPPDVPPGRGGDQPRSGVEVTCTRKGDTAYVRVLGELTEQARRPLVRILTDLMLSGTALHRVELDLCEVSFLNSAGIAALVQLQKMAQPRGIELPLAVATGAVAQPLQLSGLWHRFAIIDRRTQA